MIIETTTPYRYIAARAAGFPYVAFDGYDKEIIEELGITGIDVVSLAKKHEEVFLPKKSDPVILPQNSSALFLFQRIRDEAHRFAITYHRTLRSKSMTKTKQN